MSRSVPSVSASMHKVVLRLQWFEVLEGLARLQTLIQQQRLEARVNFALADKLEQKRLHLLSRLNTKLGLLEALCHETQEPEDWSKSTLNALAEVLESVWHETQRLGSALWQLAPMASSDDAERALNELAPLSLFSRPTCRVLLTAQTSSFNQQWPLEDCLMETLPVLVASDPLRWVGLLRQYCLNLYRQNAHLWVVAPINRTSGSTSQEKDVEPLLSSVVPHLLALRLLGPAFYALVVSEALSHRQFNFLNRIEPILFYGLNFFNYTNKTWVILHEAVERSTAFLNAPVSETASEFSAQAEAIPAFAQAKETPLQKEALSRWVPALLEAVEQCLPDKVAYSQKSFESSVRLVERLRCGLPISASSPFHSETQREAIAPITQAMRQGHLPHEEVEARAALYPLLGRIAEEPHTAAEILNAGWLYRMEMMPTWLNDVLPAHLNAGPQSAMAFRAKLSGLGATLHGLDELLSKSLETAQLHRFLMTSDYVAL